MKDCLLRLNGEVKRVGECTLISLLTEILIFLTVIKNKVKFGLKNNIYRHDALNNHSMV